MSISQVEEEYCLGYCTLFGSTKSSILREELQQVFWSTPTLILISKLQGVSSEVLLLSLDTVTVWILLYVEGELYWTLQQLQIEFKCPRIFKE